MQVQVTFLKAWSDPDGGQYAEGETASLDAATAKVLESAGVLKIEKTAKPETKAEGDPAQLIVGELRKLGEKIDATGTAIAKASQTPANSAVSVMNGTAGSGNSNGGIPNIRSGENVMSSQPFMLSRLALSLHKRNKGHSDWTEFGKRERDLCQRLCSAYGRGAFGHSGDFLVPLSTDHMTLPEGVEVEKGVELRVPDAALVAECKSMFSNAPLDWDRYQFEARRFPMLNQGTTGFLQHAAIRKDLSANATITGGALVAFPAQGELIEVLRAMEFFPQVGASEITLPPQGSIRFPRQTGTFTIAAYAEAATASESDPATLFGELLLQAKKYVGLVDIPEELLMFASVSVEAWLRGELARDLRLKTDADSINGAGGTGIQGVINYSGVVTRTASTTAAQGDTLDPQDPVYLYGDIADQNAPVEQGFFYGMRNALWARWLMNRVDQGSGAGTGAFAFSVGAELVGGRAQKGINGELAMTSTQIPNNREKGTQTDLTLLLAGVGPEWLIARGGVLEFAMTNSDASKFQQGLSTLRAVEFCDAGPKHENSFGFIDDIDITVPIGT